MQIITVPAGPLRANSYLLTENGRDAVLIDCGGSEALAQARRRGLQVAYVLLTHGHFDHVFGCAAAQEAGAKVGCSEAERAFLEAGPDLGLAMGLSVPPFTVDFTFRDGDVLDLCGMRFAVIASPGHTPGGVCFRAGQALFTGRACGGCWRSRATSPSIRGTTTRLPSRTSADTIPLPEAVPC